MRQCRRFPRPHPIVLVWAVALFFTTIGNIALWKTLWGLVDLNSVRSVLFLASLPVVLFCLFNLLLTPLLALPFLRRPLLVLLVVVSAACSYFMLHYNVLLRTRITISFVLLMAGAMGFIVLAEQVDYDQVRAAVVARTQDNEVRRLQDELARGRRPDLPSGSALFDAQDVPVVLRQYDPGYHGEAAPNEWHLRVFDSAGQRYYLLQDAAPYGYLEYLINAFAALVISICVLGAFLIGRKVATHVIAPITRLADAVQDGHKPFPYQDARDEIGAH